jgi:serine/threonine protein phosphatase 1
MPEPGHLVLDLSDRRRVLAASDVHGEFAKLEKALDEIGFDGALDTLVIVGDLFDRGPDSMAFEKWTRREGVVFGLGNHDVLPHLLLDDRIDHGMMQDFGGEWFLALDRDERRRIAALLYDAPIAITCATPMRNRVGFVHADCTKDWDDTISLIGHEMKSKREWAFDFCLQSRETIRDVLDEARAAGGKPIPTTRADVRGIDHVFHGHTPVVNAFSHGNRTWIDTDACRGGPMTVIDVDAWLDDLDRNSPFSW